MDIKDWIDFKQVGTMVVQFLPRLALAILVMIGFLILYRATQRSLSRLLERMGMHETLIRLLIKSIYRYALLLVGFVMALDQVGVNVGAALAGLGIAGVAIGFAAQDSVANVISGIMIFWDKPFIVGDWIETDGHYGHVNDITLRSTRIRTPRNTYVVIPNKSIIDSVLENYSKHGELRLDVPVGIAYKENIPQARAVLLEAVRHVEHVRADPAPDVIVRELGDSSVNLYVRVWIDDPAHQQGTFFSVVEASKMALDGAGIQIPYPHLQLFVDDVQERVWAGARSVAGAS